jgi:heat shock protein HtpX
MPPHYTCLGIGAILTRMVKRIALFLAVNVLVVITISIILNVLGVRPYLTERGIDYQALLVFCLVWGMGGAFISLGLSRIMAKYAMGVQVIDPDTRSAEGQALLQTVGRLSRAAGVPMPQVGVYESPDINAFATGPTKSRSLVAVSSGLLQRLDRGEAEGVLGHEVSHIANGDMITMTLLQGVVNAFAMFLSRVIAWALVQGRRSDDDRGGSYMMVFMVQMAIEMVLLLLGSLVVFAFSRYREFKADAGSARIAGRENMVRALEALRGDVDLARQVAQPAVQTLRISTPGGFGRFFASHPPLEERIARLKQMTA